MSRRRWLEFSGTAQQVERAFLTELHYYTVGGKRYVANASDISLPSFLAKISPGPLSLHGFGKQPPRQLQPNLTATGALNTYYVAPGDFAAIYNTTGLLSAGIDGTGISIAVTGQSQIELTDVQTFQQIFGLKINDPNIIVSGPDPGISTPVDQQESQLDVEWTGAVAPGATIDLVLAGSTDTTSGVDLAAAYAIDNEIAPIVTYTYGSCEKVLGTSGNAFYAGLWKQAAAEGITVLVASGDNGAAGCDNANGGVAATQGMAVNGAASTPYNIAVGGTQFADAANLANYWNATNSPNFSSVKGYIPEAAWNDSCANCGSGATAFSLLAGAGGASTVYSN